MKIITDNKGILGIVAIFIVIMFVYNIFFKSETSSVLSGSEAPTIGDELLQIRADLEKINFDRSLFASPGYLQLVDFSVSIPNQTIGRPNPFNVIGRD